MKLLAKFREDGLRGRSLRGSFLTILSFGSQNVLRLAGNLILTRLLFPEAFGIMAIVQVFITGLNMFSDLGIRASIVQNKRGTDPLFLDTAWLMQIGRGLFLWCITWIIAQPVADFYEIPILAELLPVVGFIAVLQGFNSTKLATANREVRLGRLTFIQMGGRVFGLAMTIALAFYWESVWGLAVGGLFGPALIMISSHVLMPGHSNRFRFDRESAGELISFGKYVFISTIAGFLISQADRAILGKFITLSELAYYNIAFFLATVPRLITQRLSDSVLFPLYSRRPPGESKENYRNLAKARFGVIGVTMILAAVLAVSGDLFIRVLYDPRYYTAGPMLILMVVCNLPKLVTGNYGAVILAHGDSKRFAIMMVSSAILQTVILYFGIVSFGVLGAIFTPFVSAILFYPAVVWFIRPYGGWLPRQDLLFILIAVAIGAIAVWVNYDVVRVPVSTALGL